MADTERNIGSTEIDEMIEVVSDFRKATYEFARGQDPGDYDLMMDRQRRIFELFRAALASHPAEVGDEGLPPLPDPWHGFQFNSGWNSWEQVSHWAVGDPHVARAYTAEQFRQGQRDAREYQKKVDEKIIARRDQTIADLSFNIGELMKAVGPSHTTNKEK